MTKQIKIEELIPKMKPGYVACNKDGTWWYHYSRPERSEFGWNNYDYQTCLSDIINIAPAEDWTKSLIKIERK